MKEGGGAEGECERERALGVLLVREGHRGLDSGSRDFGYGFVDLERPGLEQSNYGLRDRPVASAYGPSTEGTGTRVCGYVNKEE